MLLLAALLIARGADVDKAHFVPKRPFSCTSVWRRVLLRLLWKSGADTDTAALEYSAAPIYALTEYNPRLDMLDFLITQQIDINVKYPAQSGKTAGGGGRRRMKFERFNGHSTRAKISILLQSVDIFARNWHLSGVFCLFRCSFRTEICFEGQTRGNFVCSAENGAENKV